MTDINIEDLQRYQCTRKKIASKEIPVAENEPTNIPLLRYLELQRTDRIVYYEIPDVDNEPSNIPLPGYLELQRNDSIVYDEVVDNEPANIPLPGYLELQRNKGIVYDEIPVVQNEPANLPSPTSIERNEIAWKRAGIIASSLCLLLSLTVAFVVWWILSNGDTPCSSDPCLNGGNCTETDSRYSCQCITGVTGERCQKTKEKCQWNSWNNYKSWHQQADGKWSEFVNNDHNKTFDHIHTVNPGDKAIVIQHISDKPLILDSKSAYNYKTKIASGSWSSKNRWDGNWSEQHGGGLGYFLNVNDTWEEYRNGFHTATFKHIQKINDSQFAVILQESIVRSWAFILTDDSTFNRGQHEISGEWIDMCHWKGKRIDDIEISEFRRISPTSWQEYNNGQFLKSFEHIQTIQNEGVVVVIQQSNSCVKSVVLTNSSAYNNNRKFANGNWNQYNRWIGQRIDRGSCRFDKAGSTWKEYKNGLYLKTFNHIKLIPADRAVVVMTQYCAWPLILDDYSASYNGLDFAWGDWQ